MLRTADETAENPEDYISIAQNLVIMPGEENKNVTISIQNDQLKEGPENIIVELSTTNTNQISIGKNSAVVLIQDDDGKVLFFAVQGRDTHRTRFDNATRFFSFLKLIKYTVRRPNNSKCYGASKYLTNLNQHLSYRSVKIAPPFVDTT